MPAPVGFIGLGVMGQPMALNLVRAGVELVVWNRSAERVAPLREAGAQVAATIGEVFERAATVIVMLVSETVTADVLGRGTDAFEERVRGRLVIASAYAILTLSAEDEKRLLELITRAVS
jgi:3-hydroxyisobutyrate dehydrogenase